MTSIIETLYSKRFCLPSNIDIKSEDKKELLNNTNCLCGNYYHIACIFVGRGENLLTGKKIQILSYGINKYTDINGNTPSIHAEYDAISKLPPINKKRGNLYQCNIFITRFSVSNKIKNSKPCYQCILNIHNLPVQKGYQIKNVYYTDSEENIVKKKLKELLESDNPFLTRYQRNINSNRVNQEFPVTSSF
jgi:hypothetical protein